MNDNPYSALERLFHEPHRLAIMSALCRSGQGQSFNQLKNECGLTDGNLSRHLKTLGDAGIVLIQKSFIGTKPHTTVYATDEGREHFVSYLRALEEVLKQAVDAVSREQTATWEKATVHCMEEAHIQ
ncbi:MAG: ArsR family transcriptional regulator [Spartobacteria bacterium]|nr:ArsR family transcriptional regulator [Spartobacteria bacterium]